ncbi:MAG: hypothetical protein WBA07_19455 [Rivularia sp. (in: cyanobacteria)]
MIAGFGVGVGMGDWGEGGEGVEIIVGVTMQIIFVGGYKEDNSVTHHLWVLGIFLICWLECDRLLNNNVAKAINKNELGTYHQVIFTFKYLKSLLLSDWGHILI